MELTYIKAIIMGLLQGLTEFLPVSSSGHLVMIQHFWKFNPESPELILFDLAVHIGTVASILFYYRRSLTRFSGGLIRDVGELARPTTILQKSIPWRFAILALVATFSTGVIYVLAKKTIEGAFENHNTVAFLWLVTACVLLVTDRKHKTARGLRQFTVVCALIVGIAQGFAILPGISRSGSTICACLLLGLHRRWAGEFSFLIGVIAIIGAALIKGLEFMALENTSMPWGPVLAGAVVSAITGFMALSLLIWAVRKAKLKVFAIYLVIISIASLVYFNLFT